MSINYYKIYHNPMLWALILSSFLEGYWKNVPYKLMFIVLPFLFTDNILDKLNSATKSSKISSIVETDYNIDIKKEIKLKEWLTKLSIIHWVNQQYFYFDKESLITLEVHQIYKNSILKKLTKASKNLWIMLSKLENEKEIFYHLYKY